MPEDKIDDTQFDRVMILAYAFEDNNNQDHPKISWEEIKPEIEKLSLMEMEILLGLVNKK